MVNIIDYCRRSKLHAASGIQETREFSPCCKAENTLAWFMLFVYLLPDKLPALGVANRMIVMFCY
ncbi:hypothetical protein LM592_00390, partial [Candidatus Acetothermia bacterium]|nr:hypothetical protein [Candidatus Acetothermia bacterium]MCI2428891.1 hypothetical protein [Candidatus Acetothermia bacterium]